MATSSISPTVEKIPPSSTSSQPSITSSQPSSISSQSTSTSSQPSSTSIPLSHNSPPPLSTPILPSNGPISSSSNLVSTPMVFLNLPIHTKLSRTNFLAWKSQIEPLLHAYGLIQFISSPPLSSTALDPISGQVRINPEYLPWYKQDQMILAWLRASLSEPLLAQVVSCSTSADLWRYLLQTFSASSRARLTELKKKLQNLTKGGSSCSDFLQQIRSLSDELAFIGSPLADEDLVLAVLTGLGSNYNAFVIAVNSRPEPITFLVVQSLLLNHETLLLAQAPSASSLPSPSNPSAFYTHNQAGNFKPNNSHRNSKAIQTQGVSKQATISFFSA